MAAYTATAGNNDGGNNVRLSKIRIILYELFLILIMLRLRNKTYTSTDGTSRSQYIRNNLKNATVNIFVHGVNWVTHDPLWRNEKTNAYWPEMLEKDQ